MMEFALLSRIRWVLAACAFTTLVLGAVPATADVPSVEDLAPDQRERLTEHLATARDAYEAGSFETARDALSAAYDLYPHPDVVYRLALCHERLGDWRAAVERYREFLRMAPDAPESARVEGLVETLAGRIPATVTIEVQPADATVEVDAKPVQASGGRAELELPPGEHVIAVTSGEQTKKKTVTLQADETRSVEIILAESASGGTRLTPAFWGFMGSAVLFGAGAAVTTAMAVDLGNDLRDALDARDGTERPPGFDEDVARHNKLVIASWVTGGLAVASIGAALVFGIRSNERVAFIFGPDFAGVLVGASF